MRILVVGSGGREHTLAKKLRQSRHQPTVFCAPGNAGTAQIASNVVISSDNVDGLLSFARTNGIDLTVVGPEGPLCAGIVDAFDHAELRIFGPAAAAARVEGDKAFTKQLLLEAQIPTARGKCFTRFADAKAYIASRDTPQVVKAAGLAAGKGVVVCDDPAFAILEAEKMMVDGCFGEAGRRIVVEEKLIGQELSVMALVDGRSIYVLETSQDHKRIGEGDTGPNTGGMGAYSPAAIADAAVMGTIEADILVPFVDTIRRHDIEYRGVLYCGLMLTAGGPKVLEFNCRFGDPEAQVVLTRLRSDLVDVLQACIDGRLDEIELDWDPRPAVCVVMASKGYPGPHDTGQPITGLDAAEAMDDVAIYHAGTRALGDRVLTSGGRVLGVTALGNTIPAARDRAYEAVAKIHFDGAYYRRDIARRAGFASRELP